MRRNSLFFIFLGCLFLLTGCDNANPISPSTTAVGPAAPSSAGVSTPVAMSRPHVIDGLALVSEPSVTVDGLAVGITSGCPSIGFTVGTTPVQTSSATFFNVPCVDIKNGLSVEVTGQLVAGVLHAAVVKVETVDIQGVVATLSGHCPSLTFTVNGMPVLTDLTTRFNEGTCADLEDSVNVRVSGVLTAGTVDAFEVTSLDSIVNVEGAVLHLTAACPTLRFAINGTPVTTDLFTVFEEGACTDLAEGSLVKVTGRLMAGILHAKQVEVGIDKIDQTESASIEGRLDSRSGASPDLTLLVANVSVHTSAETRVQRRGDTQTPDNLFVGQRVHVVGGRLPDGSIDARKIDIKDDAPGGLVEVEGPMANVSGTCPVMTFRIGGVSVITNVLTTFGEGACDTLRSGQKATVSGRLLDDGMVAATSVKATETSGGKDPGKDKPKDPGKDKPKDPGKDNSKKGKGK